MLTNSIPTSEQIQDIHYIVCDLDGTLFHNDKTISHKTAKYLIHLQQQGYILVLATGRFFYELDEYIKQLQIDKYGGIVASANGSEIYNFKTNETYSFEMIDCKFANQMIQEAKKRNIVCYANYDHHYHVYTYFPLVVFFNLLKVCLYPIRLLYPHRLIKSFYRLVYQRKIDKHIHSLHKICFLSSHAKLTQFTKDMIKRYPDYVFYPVNEKATELVHMSVGKYQALSYITKKDGYTLKNVIAFGDSGNDQQLLKHAGIGVAMKNAILDTKSFTPYHTEYDNNEDGVYEYLHKYF